MCISTTCFHAHLWRVLRHISGMPWGSFSKIWKNIHLDSRKKWIDFGGQSHCDLIFLQFAGTQYHKGISSNLATHWTRGWTNYILGVKDPGNGEFNNLSHPSHSHEHVIPGIPRINFFKIWLRHSLEVCVFFGTDVHMWTNSILVIKGQFCSTCNPFETEKYFMNACRESSKKTPGLVDELTRIWFWTNMHVNCNSTCWRRYTTAKQ